MASSIRLTALLTLAMALYAESAHAQFPLALDGGWTFDTFENEPLPVLSQNSKDPAMFAYDFTLTASTLLTVTDCCQFGDEFDVLDGTTLLVSSVLLDAAPFGDGLGFNPALFDTVLDDPLYHGVQVVLGPGSYQLRLELSVIGGGFPASIGLRLDTGANPIPGLGSVGSIAFGLALGLAGLAESRYRRTAGLDHRVAILR